MNVPALTTHTVRLSGSSPLVGRTIAQTLLRQEHGVTVIAVNRHGEPVGNPTGDYVFGAQDVVFVIAPLAWEPDTIT